MVSHWPPAKKSRITGVALLLVGGALLLLPYRAQVGTSVVNGVSGPSYRRCPGAVNSPLYTAHDTMQECSDNGFWRLFIGVPAVIAGGALLAKAGRDTRAENETIARRWSTRWKDHPIRQTIRLVGYGLLIIGAVLLLRPYKAITATQGSQSWYADCPGALYSPYVNDYEMHACWPEGKTRLPVAGALLLAGGAVLVVVRRFGNGAAPS